MTRARHRKKRWAGRVVLPTLVAASIVILTVVAAWAVMGGRNGDPASVPGPARERTEKRDESAAEPAPVDLPVTEPASDSGKKTFTLAATGDILLHTQLWERAAQYAANSDARYNFRPMFAKVRPALSAADVAICHLETPVSPDDQNLSSFPVFNVPHEITDAIAWAGYDGCSTASNHSLDRGSAGIKATLDALEDAGLAHAGTARTAAEANKTTFYRVDGVKIAHLSYAYGFNGFSPDEAWEANKIQTSKIIAAAKRARARGSDFTIVSLHWGTEYFNDPTPWQRDIAKRLTDADAVDLIFGHHAHVVQPVHRYGPKVVVFGMGNFLSGMTTSLGHPGVDDGVIVHVTVQEKRQGFAVTKVTYTPTWVEPGTWHILPVAASLDANKTPDGLRPLLEASWERTTGLIESLDADDWGVSPRRSPR